MSWTELDAFWMEQHERDYGHFILHSIAFTRNEKNQIIPIVGLN